MFGGEGKNPEMIREPLVFEEIEVKQRNYK
jgi:hypothetical protein